MPCLVHCCLCCACTPGGCLPSSTLCTAGVAWPASCHRTHLSGVVCALQGLMTSQRTSLGHLHCPVRAQPQPSWLLRVCICVLLLLVPCPVKTYHRTRCEARCVCTDQPAGQHAALGVANVHVCLLARLHLHPTMLPLLIEPY